MSSSSFIMANYSQRFHQWHTFFQNVTEDFLAVTLCLPFTMALYALNSLADTIGDIHWLPEASSQLLWKSGRFLLTLPMMILKGVAGLMLTPIVSAVSILTQKLPAHYTFRVGKAFQAAFHTGFLQLIANYFYAPVIFKWRLNYLGFAFLGLAQLFNSEKMMKIANSLFILNQLISYSLMGIAWLQPALLPLFMMVSPASMPMMVFMGLSLVLFWAQGQCDLFGKGAEKSLNAWVTFMQKQLFNLGIMTFKNSTEAVTLDKVREINPSDLFVSNSNHAFDLTALEGNVERQGLSNYNELMRAGQRAPNLDYDDVLRLKLLVENRHNQEGILYPQLARHIRENEETYKPRAQRGISEVSLAALRVLAQKMGRLQSHPLFAEELLQAKHAFEVHFNTLPKAEQLNINQINLLGGQDRTYQLEHVLPSVYKGDWCKKGASNLILERIALLTQGTEAENAGHPVFWQAQRPTHWLAGM